MNTIIKIENGKIHTESNLCERKDVFEIVERVAEGFVIWNIGENMGTDEYIPFAMRLSYNGIASKAEAEKALKSKRKGYWSDRKREWAGKTIDIFRRITAYREVV